MFYVNMISGCISGMPKPFCPEVHFCSLLNLPTKPEERRGPKDFLTSPLSKRKRWKKLISLSRSLQESLQMKTRNKRPFLP